VTVGPGVTNSNFGFDPKSQEIILELETGVLLTNGEPVKFWKRELRAAINGNGGGEFGADAMQAFVAEIQTLFLDDPFQFTPGNELEDALDILSDNSKDPVIQLKRELLAAEFNEVSGKGLIGADDLQRAIIAWAESLVAQFAVTVSSGKTVDEPSLAGSRYTTKVGEAEFLLELLNGSTATGGGAGGEG
jgi:hypothetical protein